jgi:hypothetical protein
VEGNAREILAAAESMDDDGDLTALREAKYFLLDFLIDGPKTAKEVRAAARDAGHTPRTIDRAKAALGIASTKCGLTGGWKWLLPEGRQGGQGLASFGNLGDLRGESVTVGDGVIEAASDGWKDEL